MISPEPVHLVGHLGTDAKQANGTAPWSATITFRMSIYPALKIVVEQQNTLTLAEANELAHCIFAGQASQLELALLLGGIASRGETAEELAGFAISMRALSQPLPLTEREKNEAIDTCGTGGDGGGTFNISTGAALIAAAAGAKVAKHGSRAVTSRCGSADVLEALGIPIAMSIEGAVRAFRAQHFCFLLASSHHPSMSSVMPLRRAVGVRTIFNALGPLLNPAGVRRQVVGVHSARLVPIIARALPHLDVRRAFVVHGDGGLDELSLSGGNTVAEVQVDHLGTRIREYTVSPEDFGIQRAPLSAIEGGKTAKENAVILSEVFGFGRASLMSGPYRDVLLLNAGAALTVAGLAGNLREGVTLANQTIESRLVADLLYKLQDIPAHQSNLESPH